MNLAKPRRTGRGERWLPWLGGLLGIGALAWVLGGIDVRRFETIVSAADLRFLVLVPLIVLVEQVVRAWKWRQLLYPLRAVSTFSLFSAIMAGYLLATLIPFGFGTVARSWLVARRENLKLPAVLATVALDRLTDGLAFIGLIPLALLATLADPHDGVRAGLVWGGAGSFILFILLIVSLELFRRQAAVPGPVVTRLGERLSPRLAAVLQRVTASFAEGIIWPRDHWRGPGVVVASVVMKLLAAAQLFTAGLMFGVALRPTEYLFVMVFLGFLVIMGHFLRLVGGFLIGAVFALGLLGVPEEEAFATAAVVQVANLLSVGAVGSLALWSQGYALRELINSKATQL